MPSCSWKLTVSFYAQNAHCTFLLVRWPENFPQDVFFLIERECFEGRLCRLRVRIYRRDIVGLLSEKKKEGRDVTGHYALEPFLEPWLILSYLPDAGD